MRFFLYWNNEVVGPYEAEEIRPWNIPPETCVAPEGDQNWRTAAEFPEVLPEAVPAAPETAVARTPAPTASPTPGRKAVFIIHGKGIRLRDALAKLIVLLSTKVYYGRGKLWVPADEASLARYLLYEVQENLLLAQVDKILVTKLVIAADYPPRREINLLRDYQALSAAQIQKKREFYAAPEGGGRKKWCETALAEACGEIARYFGGSAATFPALLSLLRGLHASMVPPATPGAEFTEREFEAELRARLVAGGGMPDLVLPALAEIRRAHESGGDLDTVASNALYAAYLKSRFRAERGEEAAYGRDWAWDFVNYHQSFRHLANHRNCDIFIPDFPMDAIPDLEESAQAVAKAGSRIVRLDDHHPMNDKTHGLLSRLLSIGAIDAYVMSGPMLGEEQAEEEKTCGADLVHRAFLENSPHDNPGLAELRRIAHIQDLHLGEEPLALALSKLIGSRWSKFDMVQVLSSIRSYDELRGICDAAGWRSRVAAYESGLANVAPKLEENLVRIEFVVPAEIAEGDLAPLTGWRGLLGDLLARIIGRNPFAEAFARRHPEKIHRILISLPPYQTRKEARLNVAAAISHLKPFYRMDYYWHAWGGSLVTMRRVNDADQALDLSIVAKTLGGPGDGGHSSAATCAPPRNPHYPTEEFRRLSHENFLAYGRYLAKRLAAGLNLRIVQVRFLDPARDTEDLSHLVTPAPAAGGEAPGGSEDVSEVEEKKEAVE